MTRIIGGVAGGRRLATPRGMQTRPTSDRVREALFSALESWCGSWQGLGVMDLYAGTGALGLEARSRGAGRVLLIEHDRRTARLVADNATRLGLGEVTVLAEKVRSALDRGPQQTPGSFVVDLVLADPPYHLGEDDLARDLAHLGAWTAPGALVVLERSSRSPEPTWPAGMVLEQSRKYGETTLWYGLAAEPSRPTGAP